MDAQPMQNPAVSGIPGLMKAAEMNRELGKNLHILIRAAIPGSFCVRGIDETAWEALNAEIRNSLEWRDEHSIEIREYDHAGKEVCYHCLHIGCGITLFGMPHRQTVILYYDHNTDRQVLASITSPSLNGILMDNPDSVIIIEDAETVLMKREADNSNAVANLLNLTGGFPADVLNLNIICTFNTKTDDIDPALPERGA